MNSPKRSSCESINGSVKPFRRGLDPRPEMEKALDRAIDLSQGSRNYTIRDGKFVSEDGRRYRYAFTIVEASSWTIPDGTGLPLQSADFSVPLPIEVAETEEVTVTIIATQPLPEATLASAQLVVDRAWFFRKMKDALPYQSSPAQLGLKLFGTLDCPDREAGVQLIEMLSDLFVPDETQHLAIRRALASELLMILGPAGTGKTSVLAFIAMLHALYFNRRVLISSHTNVAIDEAIDRLTTFFRKHGLSQWLDEQRVIRFGEPALTKLLTDDYCHITVPLIVNATLEQHRAHIAELKNKREQILCQIANYEQELSRQARVWEQQKAVLLLQHRRATADLRDLEEENQHKLAHISQNVATLHEQGKQVKPREAQAVLDWQEDERKLQPLQDASQRQQNLYNAEREKWEHLRAYNGLVRFCVQHFSGEKVADLEAHMQTFVAQLDTLAEQMAPILEHQAQAKKTAEQAEQQSKDLFRTMAYWEKKFEEQKSSYEQERANYLKEIEDLNQDLKSGHPRLLQIENAIRQEKQEQARIEKKLVQLDQQAGESKREAERLVVEKAQIVGVTLTSFYLNRTLLSQEWDVVIIDEGSMAPPPAVMIAANRARLHLIIVGDSQQTQPVCKLKDPDVQHWQEVDLVQHWLGRDVFFHGGYTLEDARIGIHHCVMLAYQGRMLSPICDLIRETVYKGYLKDRNPSREARFKVRPEPEHPVVLCDTSLVKEARAYRRAGGSRFNPYHAKLTTSLAQQALADLPQESRFPECLGIVTPYRAQGDLIKYLIKGTELEICARVGTVHAFQALEFDIVIFDLVEAPGLTIAPLLKGGRNSDAMRLLNVAVTRAREKLIIVAHMKHIREQPPRSMLRQILEHAYQKQCISAESWHA